MLACVSLLQFYAFVRLRERPTAWRWVAFTLAGVLGLYTHAHYGFALVGYALVLYLDRRQLRLWHGCVSLAAIGLAYLPALLSLSAFVSTKGVRYALHLPSALPKVFVAATVGFNYFALVEKGEGRPVGLADLRQNLLLLLPVVVAGILVAWGLLRAHRHAASRQRLLRFHALFTLPIALSFGVTAATGLYLLMPKFLIYAVPFGLCMLAEAYMALEAAKVRWLLTACGVAIAAVALLHFWTPQLYGRRENWKDLAAMLRAAQGPGTQIVLLPGSHGSLDYYWEGALEHARIIAVPAAPDSAFASAVRETVNGKRDIYFVRYDIVQFERDPHDRLLKTLDSFGLRKDVVQYNPRLLCYHWHRDQE